MTVRQVMTTDVDICRPTTSLRSAAQTMCAGHFGFLPVVDEAGTVVGVLTDRDVCLALSRYLNDPPRTAVRDVMNLAVHVCRESDGVTQALAEMKRHRVRRLPVLDDRDRLCGVISIDDLVAHAGNEPGGATADAIVDALRAICEHRLVLAAAGAERPTGAPVRVKHDLDDCC